MYSYEKKRLINALLSLIYHLAFTSVCVYMFIQIIDDRCHVADVAMGIFILSNLIWISHDLYCLCSSHPKNAYKYTMDNIQPFSEMTIRKEREKIFGYISHALRILVLITSILSYYEVSCYHIIDIIIFIEIVGYIVFSIIGLLIFEPLWNKCTVNEIEFEPLI